METTDLYNIADKNGIFVDRIDLPRNMAISAVYNGNCYIALDKNITNVQERVCLAHELGHCATMSFYNIYSPLDVRGKHERRAERWAIEKLIPLSKYNEALKKGYTELNSLAEYFDVTPEFMQKTVDYYKNRRKGKNYYAESNL